MNDLSRRSVLSASALGALVVPLLPSPAALAAARSSPRLYSRARFTPLLRKRFVLVDRRRDWSMRLVAVSDIPGARRGADQSFSLTFRSKSAGPSQGAYEIRRRGFAPTSIFVVPSDADRRTYQAVVNRSI